MSSTTPKVKVFLLYRLGYRGNRSIDYPAQVDPPNINHLPAAGIRSFDLTGGASAVLFCLFSFSFRLFHAPFTWLNHGPLGILIVVSLTLGLVY